MSEETRLDERDQDSSDDETLSLSGGNGLHSPINDPVYRFLIADDEDSILQLIRRFFEREAERTGFTFKYTLDCVADGPSAIEAVRRAQADHKPYAVVFIDVFMPPGQDGIHTAREIRKLDTFTQIVLITGKSADELHDEVARILPRDRLLFMLKPLNEREVMHLAVALANKWTNERRFAQIQRQLNKKLRIQTDDLINLNERLQKQIRYQKRIEQKLHRYGIIINNIDEAVVLSDINGFIFDANPAFVRMYGYSVDYATGKQLDFLNPNGEATTGRILDTIREDGHWSGELEFVTGNGERRWSNTSVKKVIDPQDGSVFLVGINSDITEQKRTRYLAARQRLLLDDVVNRINEGIGIVDHDETILFANKAFADIFETNPIKITGCSLFDFIDEEARQSILKQTGIRKLNRHTTYELEIRTVQNNRKAVRVSAYPRFDDNNEYIGSFGVLQDITDQKRLHAQFLQSQKMEAMGRLAGGVAHDFNNLLTIINGSAELLKMSLSGNDGKSYIEDIISASLQAKKLTEQLLLFSRKQDTSLEPLDLNLAVTEIQKLLNRIIGKNIQIQIELVDPVGVIEADPGQIRQILMNLAVNSKDAMPGGGTIRITTGNIRIDKKLSTTIPHSRVGEFVCLTFEDNGRGMSEETLSRIFEPFFTTKEQGKGTGLGLATVFGIVERHGGWLNVKSREHHGTVFQIYFPRRDFPEIFAETTTEEAEHFSGNDQTVLIVEDNPAVRRFTVEALSRHQYNVISADNGASARLLFTKNRDKIQILLTNLVLPDSSGIYLIQHFTRENPNLKVCISSGYTLEPAHSDFITSNKIALLTKPYTMGNLLKTMSSVHPLPDSEQPSCELVAECTFLLENERTNPTLNLGWKRMFCFNIHKSDRCKRKKHYLDTGHQPESRMTPTGHYLKE